MAFHYSPKIVTDGLILYLDAANYKSYPGSGTIWTDISKSDYNATLTNTTFNSSNNGSLLFDGLNSFATISNFSIGTTYTINVWFKQTSAIANRGLFGLSGTNDGFFYLGGSGSNPEVGIAVKISGVPSYSLSIPVTSPTIWNMATYVINGNSYTIYLNAGSELSGVLSGLPNSGTAYVGMYPDLQGRFNGNISNVSVYSRSLSKNEIQSCYKAMISRYQ